MKRNYILPLIILVSFIGCSVVKKQDLSLSTNYKRIVNSDKSICKRKLSKKSHHCIAERKKQYHKNKINARKQKSTSGSKNSNMFQTADLDLKGLIIRDSFRVRILNQRIPIITETEIIETYSDPNYNKIISSFVLSFNEYQKTIHSNSNKNNNCKNATIFFNPFSNESTIKIIANKKRIPINNSNNFIKKNEVKRSKSQKATRIINLRVSSILLILLGVLLLILFFSTAFFSEVVGAFFLLAAITLILIGITSASKKSNRPRNRRRNSWRPPTRLL